MRVVGSMVLWYVLYWLVGTVVRTAVLTFDHTIYLLSLFLLSTELGSLLGSGERNHWFVVRVRFTSWKKFLAFVVLMMCHLLQIIFEVYEGDDSVRCL